ncbi:ribonuclease H-like domain-containing protein [Tanacetum coccineum]
MVTRSQKGIVKPLERLSLHTSSVSPIPKSPFLALKDPNWCNAMYDEYNTLVKNGTWILVPRPTDANLVAYLLIYVDYIILIASSPVLLQQIAYSLHKEFDMTDLGTLNYFLGISAIRHPIGSIGCPSTRRSTSGYCVFLGDNFLSWSAKRQHTISRSSAEAEYRDVANVVIETAWIRNLLLGHVRVLHVPSRFQYADIFTKGLPSALFEDFCSSLSVRPHPAPTAGAY